MPESSKMFGAKNPKQNTLDETTTRQTHVERSALHHHKRRPKEEQDPQEEQPEHEAVRPYVVPEESQQKPLPKPSVKPEPHEESRVAQRSSTLADDIYESLQSCSEHFVMTQI